MAGLFGVRKRKFGRMKARTGVGGVCFFVEWVCLGEGVRLVELVPPYWDGELKDFSRENSECKGLRL
jgi:hypothetical protein